MGQKVHPIGMRVGIIRDWDAKWYAEKEYADYLHEDLAIRKFVQKELADAAVSTIEIERAVNIGATCCFPSCTKTSNPTCNACWS